MADETKKPVMDEVASLKKDIDIFDGYLGRMENPDPTLRTESNGKGLKLYDEVDRDPHAGSVLQTRYLAVSGAQWEIKPGEDTDSARKIADFITGVLSDTNFSQFCQEILQGILYGYFVGEVIWKVHNGNVAISKIRAKHPRRFVFDDNRGLRLLTRENMVAGYETPERKFIVFSYGSSDNPYGKGLGQKLWWPVWFKKNGIKFWLVFLDKFGQPTPVGKYPPGATDPQKKDLLDTLDAIQTETGIIIPDNMAVAFLESTRTGNVTYETLCDYMDRQISKAVLGQTLTTEVKGEGSYAAGKVHDDVRHDILEADAGLLAEVLNETLIEWLVDFNFAGVTAYPKIHFQVEESEDLGAALTIDKGLHEMGLAIPTVHLYEKYSVPVPENGEETIKKTEEPAIDPDKKSSEFAEDIKKNGYIREISAQEEIDAMTDTVSKAGISVFENYIQEIKAFLSHTDSLETAKDNIISMYDMLDSAPLAESLTGVLMDSDRVGVESVGDFEFSEAMWGEGKPFSEAIDFFSAKSFTIAGVTNVECNEREKKDNRQAKARSKGSVWAVGLNRESGLCPTRLRFGHCPRKLPKAIGNILTLLGDLSNQWIPQ